VAAGGGAGGGQSGKISSTSHLARRDKTPRQLGGPALSGQKNAVANAGHNRGVLDVVPPYPLDFLGDVQERGEKALALTGNNFS